jgi:uncharacterized protein (DUF2267 family)
LLSAAIGTGIGPRNAGKVVQAVLSIFLQRLPEGERRHIIAHLPPDVRRLATIPHRVGRSHRPARTVAELTAQVMSADGMSAEQADQVIAAVLGTLRVLIPEEAADVASVLPSKLRVLWETAGDVNSGPPDGRTGIAGDGDGDDSNR